ncbi:MAG: hypothetical protein K2X74_15250 [Acetobacteraceae bacterium]|nr:hypothetical protein [Acetobacteraceae bacterium]
MTPPELRALVADSIAVWDVAGAQVTLDGMGVVVTAAEGTPLRITPAAPADAPLRWWLDRPGQRRPYPGITGLLRGLRNALGAGEGVPSRLRGSPG